ncbi:MAG TPA: hypothetical protein VD835_16690, partial [Pyrinomonadaceae bacterium]|nr:hypothetical protein [Pyrinomonadaceae bacterium]
LTIACGGSSGDTANTNANTNANSANSATQNTNAANTTSTTTGAGCGASSTGNYGMPTRSDDNRPASTTESRSTRAIERNSGSPYDYSIPEYENYRTSPHPGSTASPPVLPAPQEKAVRSKSAGRTRRDSVDAYLDSLPLGEVAFNTPEKMRLGQTVNVELKLGGAHLVGQLEELIKEEGRVETHRVKVASVMEARLVGTGFEIATATPPEQVVSESKPTEWEWQVKATREGTQRLHLTLNAVVFVDGKERRRKTETFKKDILVEVTPGSRIAAFFYDNVGWIVPVLLLPFIGKLGLHLRKVLRRRGAPPAPPAR